MSEELRLLEWVPAEAQALLITNILEPHGIATLIQPADAMTAIYVAGGPRNVLVRADQFERAREVLDSELGDD